MKFVELEVVTRDKTGKSAARSWRRRGYIPGIVYGQDISPQPIGIPVKDFTRLAHHSSRAGVVVKLKLEGKELPALIKEVALDPVKDTYLHVDFQKIRLDEKVSTLVPIVIIGEEVSPGLKMGGVLQHGLDQIEIEALPKDLPEKFEIDISSFEIGDSCKVSDLTPPPGVTILEDPEEVILTILPPTIYKEAVEEVVGEEVAGEERPAGEAPSTEEQAD